MRLKQFLLILFITPTVVAAQYNSNKGWFQVDEKKGCAPFTVTITSTGLVAPSTPCTGATPCQMDWGDGTPASNNVFTHTYTQPGTYKLRVLFQTVGPDEIDIVVTPNTQPAFDVFTCSGQEVQVVVTDTNYDSYIINYNDATAEVAVPKGSLAVNNHTYATAGLKTISVRGKNVSADDNCTPPATKQVTVVNALAAPFINTLTVTAANSIDLAFTSAPNVLYRLEVGVNTPNGASFQLYQTLHDVSTVTVSNSNLRADDNYYCFRLGTVDPCSGAILYSNIICSSNFDLSVQNNSNNLSWVTSTTGVTNFTVSRDGTNIGNTTALTYADNNVVCKTNYCYQLTSNYANTSRSISLQKCGVAISTTPPAPVNNVTAIVGDNGIDLIWQQDPLFTATEYSVFRKIGTGNLSLLSKTTTQQINDTGYISDGSYCYRVNYVDACGNTSTPGIDVCPIVLTGSIDNDNSITLNWTAYNGWINGVSSYTVEKYDATGILLQTFDVGTSTTFEDSSTDPAHQKYVYVVLANANDTGLGQAISNEVTMIKEPNLNYPTAFTPNGDNLNDVFVVYGQFVEKFEMNIFNRWGELLFYTDNLDTGWDGKFKGVTQPEGTYAFIATLTDQTGRTFKRSGSVVLLRKAN
ncbi:MAG TPA: gliding motility-associated C-terminal domain-containing protein [Cyclobacteriaceae bacterium]|nr:gliding motility-associated C-terminal domain-containing protein [Cyclobacteriaceae bacterium]